MKQDYKSDMRAMTEGLAEWCQRRKRRQRATRTIIGIATVVAVTVITSLPDPDGHYVSNLQAREEIINTLDQTLIAKL